MELETEGVAYGELALTIALHGPLEQTERLDGDILRIFAAHDAKVIREGYGQLPAWFCRLPAQPRKRQVRNRCLCRLARRHVLRRSTVRQRRPRAEPRTWTGPRSPSSKPSGRRRFTMTSSTATWATRSSSARPAQANRFTLNFLLVQALQYHPRVLILDLGGSYRWITRFLGGGYLELSPDDASGGTGFRLRPFSLPHPPSGPGNF